MVSIRAGQIQRTGGPHNSLKTRLRAAFLCTYIVRCEGIEFTVTLLLSPQCRDLLEQLTGLQQVKKFPAFHGTRRFITALTSVRHLSLSWVSPIQSIDPHPISWRSVLILSTHLRLGLPIGLLTLPPDPVLSQLPRYNTSKYSW